MKYINIEKYFKQEIEKLRELRCNAPSLMIIDATEGDPANQIYIRNKIKDFNYLGWRAEVFKVETTAELKKLLGGVQKQGFTSAIVQMPVARDIEFTYDMVSPLVDVDGLAPASKVIPATVRGIIDYLDACEFEYESKSAVVLGRSDIVGRPMAKALLDKNMTVSICHSKTTEMDKMYLLRKADLVICATGVPQSIYRAQCPYAFVVDVGISRIGRRVVGDFVEDFNKVTQGSTPVPGGVGLLTRLGLMKNCVELANAFMPCDLDGQCILDCYMKKDCPYEKLRNNADVHFRDSK